VHEGRNVQGTGLPRCGCCAYLCVPVCSCASCLPLLHCRVWIVLCGQTAKYQPTPLVLDVVLAAAGAGAGGSGSGGSSGDSGDSLAAQRVLTMQESARLFLDTLVAFCSGDKAAGLGGLEVRGSARWAGLRPGCCVRQWSILLACLASPSCPCWFLVAPCFFCCDLVA
jgi:hypothetical protein